MPKETHLGLILLKSRLFLSQRMERRGLLMDMGRTVLGGTRESSSVGWMGDSKPEPDAQTSGWWGIPWTYPRRVELGSTSSRVLCQMLLRDGKGLCVLCSSPMLMMKG